MGRFTLLSRWSGVRIPPGAPFQLHPRLGVSQNRLCSAAYKCMIRLGRTFESRPTQKLLFLGRQGNWTGTTGLLVPNQIPAPVEIC